jgi:hypothetical protein
MLNQNIAMTAKTSAIRFHAGGGGSLNAARVDVACGLCCDDEVVAGGGVAGGGDAVGIR